MEWSPQQSAALKAVQSWLADPRGAKVFRLFGYAGTGKTTIAKEIAAGVRGKVMFMAFTGKAALVLSSKGCTGASTIHSAIYKVADGADGKPTFVLNRGSDVVLASLVIVDEVSMVGPDLGQDLLKLARRVLVLGDPAQLPPVKGTGFFIEDKPNFVLTEIHRQAADNPIIRMSMDVREGRGLQLGTYGDSKVILRSQLEQQEVLDADQVLIGLNRTRRTFNARMRELLGFTDAMPMRGDRLICLKNNKERGLLNGGLWDVEAAKVTDILAGKFRLVIATLQPDALFSASSKADVLIPSLFFEGREGEMHWSDRKEFDEFDYGYAITVHKSQGSQWDNVMLFDESASFRESATNWLYTAVTRAAERVTVVL